MLRSEAGRIDGVPDRDAVERHRRASARLDVADRALHGDPSLSAELRSPTRDVGDLQQLPAAVEPPPPVLAPVLPADPQHPPGPPPLAVDARVEGPRPHPPARPPRPVIGT